MVNMKTTNNTAKLSKRQTEILTAMRAAGLDSTACVFRTSSMGYVYLGADYVGPGYAKTLRVRRSTLLAMADAGVLANDMRNDNDHVFLLAESTEAIRQANW